jgi:KaiC/GvpD/RAD55 family RecA-like ATPase
MPTDKSKFSEYGIEDYLSDGIIMLEMKEFERKVIRQISVVKMRATHINTDIFSLVFEKGKFKALYGGRNPLV